MERLIDLKLLIANDQLEIQQLIQNLISIEKQAYKSVRLSLKFLLDELNDEFNIYWVAKNLSVYNFITSEITQDGMIENFYALYGRFMEFYAQCCYILEYGEISQMSFQLNYLKDFIAEYFIKEQFFLTKTLDTNFSREELSNIAIQYIIVKSNFI